MNARQQRALLDARDERNADVNAARVVEPLGNGSLHRVQELATGTIYVAAGPPRTTWKPGTVVLTGSHLNRRGKVILVGPPPGRKGASAFPAPSFQVGTISHILVSALVPGELLNDEAGQVVTISGVGFRAATTFEVVRFVDGAWEADPRYALGSVVIVSGTSATATLDVGATVAAGEKVSIRGAQGARRHVGRDLATIVAQPVPQLIGIMLPSSASSQDLTAHRYGLDGSDLGAIATFAAGDFQTDPSELGVSVFPVGCFGIGSDIFGHVGDNALGFFCRFQPGAAFQSAKVRVWDIAGGAVYTQSSGSVTIGGQSVHTRPVAIFKDGWIYQLAMVDLGVTYRVALLKMRTNCTSDGTTPGYAVVSNADVSDVAGALPTLDQCFCWATSTAIHYARRSSALEQLSITLPLDGSAITSSTTETGPAAALGNRLYGNAYVFNLPGSNSGNGSSLGISRYVAGVGYDLVTADALWTHATAGLIMRPFGYTRLGVSSASSINLRGAPLADGRYVVGPVRVKTGSATSSFVLWDPADPAATPVLVPIEQVAGRWPDFFFAETLPE